MITVNKITLPVAIDSVSYSEEAVGAMERNANGYMVADRRSMKARIQFSTVPRGLDEAMMYRAILAGEGEFFPFVESGNQFGLKGLKATATVGSSVNSSINANPLDPSGSDFVMDANHDIFFPNVRPRLQVAVAGYAPNPGIDGQTIIGFRTLSGLSPRIFGWSWRSAVGSIATSRERLGSVGSTGSPQAYTGNESVLTFDGSRVQARTPTNETTFSAVFSLPRYFPAAQVDALMAGYDAGGFFVPAMPRVAVETDLFPGTLASASSGRRSFIALAEVKTVTAIPHYRSGTFDKSAVSLEVELVEV
jgi:hypothetical protein